jgi:histidinol-phosphate aminotransferase
MSQLIRNEILGLSEYALKQYPCRIKLNQNENPYELPEAIKREIMDTLACARWSRYPAFVPEEQIEAVASFTGWQKDGVLLGNGSNDLLQLAIVCLLERGTPVVISQPTFTLYKLLAQSLGAHVVEVPMRTPFAFDLGAIAEAANRHRARLVVLCSPNNPTGTCLSREQVRQVLDGTDAIVILDEAYVQFAKESQVPLLGEYDRLVILQTFSKAMAAAGLRFGYALCRPGLARQLNKVKLPYSVNIFTLIAAGVLMKRWETIRNWIGTIVSERERIRSRLSGLPHIQTYESGANFILFETLQKTPTQLFDGLLHKGILIRDVSSYPMLGHGLRVSVGSAEENDEFLNALQEVL